MTGISLPVGTRHRIGVHVAGASIAFSTLSIGLYFAFTPIVALAALFGAVGVVLAFAVGARRTAIVAAAFAMAPLCQLLVERLLNGELLILAPAMVAISIAAWSLVTYVAERRLRVRSTA